MLNIISGDTGSGVGSVKGIVGGLLLGAVGGGGGGSAGGPAVAQKVGSFMGSWRSGLAVLCPSLGLHGLVHHGGGTDPGHTGMPARNAPHVTLTSPLTSGGRQRPQPLSMAEVPVLPVVAPLKTVDLCRLGPMRLPRLWSALHDALLYNDPLRSQGGKVRKVMCS